MLQLEYLRDTIQFEYMSRYYGIAAATNIDILIHIGVEPNSSTLTLDLLPLLQSPAPIELDPMDLELHL